MPQPHGRLELTWTNKHLRLLAHEDGSYEWVPPADFRVAEVRLLHDAGAVGDVHFGRERAKNNLLIRGDALSALTSLVHLPEFEAEYVGRVKLAYLDPPFNTQQSFLHYDDALEHSVWLTMIRDRLLQIRDLLSPEGTLWLHLDDSEVHRARSVLDEVFGAANFVAEMIWRSSDNSNNDATQFSSDHNTLLVYSRTSGWRSNRLPATPQQVPHYTNPDNDPNGPWFDGNPLNSPNPRENLKYEITSPTGFKIAPPPNGWRWSPETLWAKIASAEIRFTPDGRSIRRRTYLRDHEGLPASSLWVDLADTGHNRQAKAELKKLFPGIATSALFKTPKPERLLRKILRVASDPDDIVLDCFLGSGTTAAVAHAGCEARVTGPVPDQAGILHDALGRVPADVVVSVGGVAAGERDLLAGVAAELGQAQSWRVALRPGTPFLSARIGGMILLGLPGNPVAALVGFEVFVRPVICRLLGLPATVMRRQATLANEITQQPGRLHYIRGQCMAGG